MPTNKNASIRYQALDKCFRDFRHRYFVEDLIDRCEEALESFNFVGGVSRRQIFDDIRYMESDAGWSIPLDRLKDGKKTYYRYIDKNFSINQLPLTDEEAQQLQTAILTLSRFRGLPSNGWIDEVISSLKYRFNLNSSSEHIICFEQNQNLKGLNFLTSIIDATSSHHVIKIAYCNYKNGGKEMAFTLHPYFLKQYNNRWFLFGLENMTHLISNLALDRIVSIEAANEVNFIPNDEVDFEHYFDDVVGVTVPRKEMPKEKIILKFSKERFPYVVSKPIHLSQKIISEQDCIVSIDVKPTRELDQQIFSFGPDVEIVSPEPYRNNIKEKIEENLKKYFVMQDGCTADPEICNVN